MQLSQVITKARSAQDLNDIFKKDVTISLGWINDEVSVGGYEGYVSTDTIARAICHGIRTDKETKESKELASNLAKKVFFPLKKLVESPENQCSLYQIAALVRVRWTPPQNSQFGRSIALKHAMVLDRLDSAKYSYWE